MMAIGLMPMIAAVGSAIDLARIYIATSQMQAGADAAALAGANAFDNKDNNDQNGRRKQVIAYFEDNYPADYMGIQSADGATPIGGSRALLEPQFTTVAGISRTIVNATGKLPMTFLSIFGVGPKVISVTAHAEFQPHPLEVMVVLDNTGSMLNAINGTPKITALKTAMHGFINVLFQGGDAPQPNLAMGIINYTNQANVGSILKDASIPYEAMPGFTNLDWSAGDGMGWKGCVANDESVTNVSASASKLLTVEPGAYDLTNVLPGETPPGATHPMIPIRPLLIPPLWKPADMTATQVTPPVQATSGFYKPSDQTSFNNLYGGLFTSTPTAANAASAATTNQPAVELFANTATFKRFFYRNYIAMNNGAANMGDDVIVTINDTYYDPTQSGAYDPVAKTGVDFKVRVDKIPNLAFYRPVSKYQVTSNNTLMPSPNWQCPEPGLPIKYNVSRSTFDSYIDNHVWAVLPANGTMHHTGFIWGWRMLSRYDKFSRDKPEGSGMPLRALVFMTDGKNEIGDYSASGKDPVTNANKTFYANDKVYTAYGSLNDRTITSSVNNSGAVSIASSDRFKKACAMANAYTFPDSRKPPQIYVVAINRAGDIDAASQTMLRNCGSSGYWLSTTPTDLNNAFAQIARTLIDVHLTQ